MCYLSHSAVQWLSDGALARNSPSDYAKLIYLKRRNPGYKWGDEPPPSCVFMCAPFSRAPQNAACARFDRLIHKFLMNARLIRLCIRPYAARVPVCVCVCVRAFSRPRTNSSSSYLSYLFTRPSALSFIGTDYTADLAPPCQILRPGSCSGRIRGAFLVFVTQFCLSRSPRMSSFVCSLSRRPSRGCCFFSFFFLRQPVIDACPMNPGRLSSRGS